jgi:HD-GYP domain-containing protein (c-di-GMP phosphodiesterase class II)
MSMGYPLEHGLHTTLIAMRLADRLGVDRATASQTYFASLLSHAGCTTDAHVATEIFGDSLTTHFHPVMYGSGREVLAGLLRALPEPDRAVPVRALQVARGLPRMARTMGSEVAAACEVAAMLAAGVGVPASMAGVLAFLTERWDGRGPLHRAKREQIPLSMRIVHVATDASFQRLLGGTECAARVVRARAGAAFDPEVAHSFADNAATILRLDDHESAWDGTLRAEPEEPLMLFGDAIDRALEAMGNFADLIAPQFAGHCVAVAELAVASSQSCRIDPTGTTTLRRAALVHDIGRVATGARIWQKPGALNPDEWEQVRLHAYHTERVLSHSPFLSLLCPVAGAHHERLDGSGYHRGSSGADLTPAARVLAAADAYHAMIEPRAHRAAMSPEEAAAELVCEARAGRLDGGAVTAVVEAAGLRAPRLERPAGLTEREAEVIAMLARDLQTKQVAQALGISTKTADHHVQNAYRKMGVSSRAAATLFAMQNGLVAWGELPMAQPARSS